MEKDFINSISYYVELFSNNNKLLLENSRKFTSKCNELTFNEERLEVLKKVNNSLKSENPLKDNCPTCRQNLPSSLEDIYAYFQNVNDTTKQINFLNEKIKKIKNEIEKLKNKQKDLENKHIEYYSILKKHGIVD